MVRFLSSDAFRLDTKLKSVNLSSKCLSILDSTFYGCSALTSVGDISSLTIIKINTFNGCSSLKSVNLSSNCITIE